MCGGVRNGKKKRWKWPRSVDLASCGKPKDTLIGNHLCALCYMESLEVVISGEVTDDSGGQFEVSS